MVNVGRYPYMDGMGLRKGSSSKHDIHEISGPLFGATFPLRDVFFFRTDGTAPNFGDSTWPNQTHSRRIAGFSMDILLLEEILHHLGCIKPGK